MPSLYDDQIEFILNDIKARGIKIESLQLNLLDHICCILEQDPETENNFETVYQKTIKTFFKNDLAEIEKETILLVNFKHYYLMKKIMYALLFFSISYNIYAMGRMAFDYFQHKGEMDEITIKKDVTMQEGTLDLIQKIKQEYPQVTIKNKICVSFLSDFFFVPWDENSPEANEEIAVEMGITTDSLIKRRKRRKDADYFSLDSLAGLYKNVTFVVTYLRTGEEIDDVIQEYKAKTKNVLFIKGVNKLYSGYQNSNLDSKKQPKPVRGFPLNFVVDSNGNLIYHRKRLWIHLFDKELIKTLSGK